MTIDYADENIITANNTTVTIPEGTIVVNNSSAIILNKEAGIIVAKSSDKIYNKYPIVSMWAKPSVRSRYSYTWYRFKFIDYCPNCHHYHCLLKNPKCVPEREYTCKYCDSDYCAVTGKEKYSWSHVYLRKV